MADMWTSETRTSVRRAFLDEGGAAAERCVIPGERAAGMVQH